VKSLTNLSKGHVRHVWLSLFEKEPPWLTCLVCIIAVYCTLAIPPTITLTISLPFGKPVFERKKYLPPTSHNLSRALFDNLQRPRPCQSSRKFTPPPSSASSTMATTSICPRQDCSWPDVTAPSCSSPMIPSIVPPNFLNFQPFLPFLPSLQLEDVYKARTSFLPASLETLPRSEWRTTRPRSYDVSKRGFSGFIWPDLAALPESPQDLPPRNQTKHPSKL